MPIYDKRTLSKKAKELGFIRDTYEKMYRLTEILRFFNENEELCSHFALKGGTAINLTIFNLPRLSVDIDLDFTKNYTRDKLMPIRSQLGELLPRYMAAEGYIQSPKSKQTHALDSYVYSYTNAAGNNDNIKIEINYMLRSHLFEPEIVEVKAENVFLPFPVRSLAPMEIYASKAIALTSRVAARDLYDFGNMVSLGLFDESEKPMFRKCILFYHAITGNSSGKEIQIENINGITYHIIRTDLLPMIRGNEKFNLEETKKQVMQYLSEMMILEEQEKQFIQYFSKGIYKPELLFDDPEITERIKSHPMAMWRTQRNKEESNR